jgi:hypothetical protein
MVKQDGDRRLKLGHVGMEGGVAGVIAHGTVGAVTIGLP